MSGNQSCSKFSRTFLILKFPNTNISLLGRGKETGDQNIQDDASLGEGFQHLAGMCCATLRFFILF